MDMKLGSAHQAPHSPGYLQNYSHYKQVPSSTSATSPTLSHLECCHLIRLKWFWIPNLGNQNFSSRILRWRKNNIMDHADWNQSPWHRSSHTLASCSTLSLLPPNSTRHATVCVIFLKLTLLIGFLIFCITWLHEEGSLTQSKNVVFYKGTACNPHWHIRCR